MFTFTEKRRQLSTFIQVTKTKIYLLDPPEQRMTIPLPMKTAEASTVILGMHSTLFPTDIT